MSQNGDLYNSTWFEVELAVNYIENQANTQRKQDNY